MVIIIAISQDTFFTSQKFVRGIITYTEVTFGANVSYKKQEIEHEHQNQ